jgi:hypothetical protein
MRASAKTENAHTRSHTCVDAANAILDDEAMCRRDADPVRRMEEDVGIRLAARHEIGAENPVGERFEKSDRFKAHLQALSRA